MSPTLLQDAQVLPTFLPIPERGFGQRAGGVRALGMFQESMQERHGERKVRLREMEDREGQMSNPQN